MKDNQAITIFNTKPHAKDIKLKCSERTGLALLSINRPEI